MSEHKPGSQPEQQNLDHERREERLKPKFEQEPNNTEKHEQNRQERLAEARETAERESRQTEKRKDNNQTEPIRITKTDKRRAYQMTISRVRSQLPRISRGFSRTIHNKQVEKASEVLEKTIARPSGILGGSVAAATGLAIMLFFAKRYGFVLAGSEFIILLIAGWVIGITIEIIFRLLRRRRHH